MNGSRRRFLAAATATVLGGCAEPGTDATGTGGRNVGDRAVADVHHDREGTTIGFAGDAMLGRNLDERYGQDDASPAAVWSDLRPRLASLDAVCCNLECCLSTRGERFPDRAYYFRADPEWAVPALEAGNVRFVSLANNHMLDYGPTALVDTVEALDEGGINHAGAGKGPADAHAPATFTVDGVDVAVVSFADHFEEYGVTDDRPGTAYIECDRENDETRRIVEDALERAREHEPDLLVASLHWGSNWVEEPGAEYVAFGHWLVDQGVDLVHGHSAHIPQGVERYGDGLILHDTGDIVDDYAVKPELRNDRTFLFEVGVDDDGTLEDLRLVPARIDDYAVHQADETDAEWLHETMVDRSEPFGTTYERDGTHLHLSL
ncbi:CapA family protein [Halopiger djelfimassiliensis]|uniref:CapA family protein n=1 Tax=Halopiger djelfimassiliensis TaxID=1293047 RepID=UPI0006783303|nr:CapA family protein [Halopiger djelfimassiliensis]